MLFELLEMRHRLLRLLRFPVSIIDDKIIVLRAILREAEVLPQEAQQLGTGSIVGKFFRSNIFTSQHQVEKHFALTAALHTLMNVEVEHAQWPDLLHLSEFVGYEQVSFADLDEADDSFPFGLHVDFVVGRKQTACRRNHLRESLRLG